MTTWASIREYLAANYHFAAERDDQILLEFETGAGRSQRVSIDLETIDDRPWICISSGFGEVGKVDIERALLILESRVFGAIGRVGGFYVVKHAAPLDDMSAEELELPMQLTLTLADELEAKLGGQDRF